MRGVAVDVTDLTISDATGRPVVDQVSLHLPAGATLGIVGESGSGKTSLALAVLGLIRPGLHASAGQVAVAELSVLTANSRALRHLRRHVVAYLGQDPATSLEPTMRIGPIVSELTARRGPGDESGREALADRMAAVGLPGGSQFSRRYPHQLSGGQQQRVALARSLSSDPAVLILDEPTTGIDVVIQELILTEVAAQRQRLGFTTLVISHDLAIVARLTDSTIVMRAGQVVDRGAVVDLFAHPRHPYTAALVAACPDPTRLRSRPALRPTSEGGPPRLKVVDLFASHQTGRASRLRRPGIADRPATVVAAAGVSFQVDAGECLALVGSSGSGKTTIARVVTGLHHRDRGDIFLAGRPLAANVSARSVEERGRIQLIPQDPYGSLNPRRTVGAAIARPMRTVCGLSDTLADQEVSTLLGQVQLRPEFANRYPRELSGGERQRVAIARALAAQPAVLICDEITSSLDTSVQASVLDLLDELRVRLGLALLLITHDFGVVARVADRVLVLDHGRMCEQGPAAQVLSHPTSETTRRLLAACRSLGSELEQRRTEQEKARNVL